MANKNSLKSPEQRIALALKSSTYLLAFATVFSVIVGSLYLKASTEMKELEKFLGVNTNVENIFIERQQAYINGDKEIIEHIAQIRPESTEDFVKLITTLETVTTALGINATIQSKPGGENAASIEYQISFVGSLDDVNNFIRELEKLPYIIQVNNVIFSELALQIEDANGKTDIEYRDNCSLSISVFIK